MIIEKVDYFEAFGCRVTIKDQKVLIFCKDFHNPKHISVNIMKYLILEGFAHEAISYEIEVVKEKT